MKVKINKQYVESILGVEITDEMLNDWNVSDRFREYLMAEELDCFEMHIKVWVSEACQLMKYHQNECARLNGFVEWSEEGDYHRNQYHQLRDLLLVLDRAYHM